jgi:hypothetical protein
MINKNFLKYLIVNLMNKYGSFMWIGIHLGSTQVDWHWVLETLLCIGINLLVLYSIFLEWSEKSN